MGLLRALMAGVFSGWFFEGCPDVRAKNQTPRQQCVLLGRGLVTSVLAGVCVGCLLLWTAEPALAQDNSVDYTLTNQAGADFSGQDLSGTSFAAADVRHSNFSGSDLSKTILTKAAFINSDLSGVDLTDSFMDRVAFENCDLTNAVLKNIVATSTSFEGTDIKGADFSDAILDRYQTYLLCQRAEGVNSTTGIETRESLLCK